MGYWENDLTWTGQSLSTEPRAYHFYNLRGNYYYQQGHYQQALSAYRQLETAGPEQLKRPITLEQVVKLGDKDRIFRQAFIESRKKQATVLLEQGNWQLALPALQQLINYFPQDHQLHYQLGRCWQAKGDNQAATAAYEKSLALNPNYLPAKLMLNQVLSEKIKQVNAMCSQAKLLADQRHFEEAERLLQQAVMLAPDYDRPYHYLFNLYWLQGEKQKAKGMLLEAIRCNPDNQLYLYNLKSLEP